MKPRLIDQPGRARTALIVPGLFGAAMVALAVASGNGGLLLERLPLPEPGPGWTLAVLAGAGCFAWWRMHRADTPASDECPPEREKWPLDDPGVGPWFGTPPFPEPGPDVPRRNLHIVYVEEPDPDMARAFLLADDDPAGTVR